MAISTGTSVLGLQLLGNFSTSAAGWQLRFASSPQQDRLRRLGTALHTRTVSSGRFPVVEVYKVFGGGLAPVTIVIPNSSQTQLWVRWFVADVVWAFDRPD